MTPDNNIVLSDYDIKCDLKRHDWVTHPLNYWTYCNLCKVVSKNRKNGKLWVYIGPMTYHNTREDDAVDRAFEKRDW